jgi:hypothetical protein
MLLKIPNNTINIKVTPKKQVVFAGQVYVDNYASVLKS